MFRCPLEYKIFLLFSTAVLALPGIAAATSDSGQGTVQFSLPQENRDAAKSGNPWDYGEEQKTEPTDAGETGKAEPAKPKHWTEMDYEELKTELERTDTKYSIRTKKEMRARLATLDTKAPTEKTGNEQETKAATGNMPVVESGGKENTQPNVAVPVRMVPAQTPWWKLPKDQRAAAREAQRNQQTGSAPAEKKELSPREQMYENIRKNRGQ